MSNVDLYVGDTGSERQSSGGRRRTSKRSKSRPKSTSHKGHRSRSKQASKSGSQNPQEHVSHTTITQIKAPAPVVYPQQTPASPESRSSIDSDNSIQSFRSGLSAQHGGVPSGGGGARGSSEVGTRPTMGSSNNNNNNNNMNNNMNNNINNNMPPTMNLNGINMNVANGGMTVNMGGVSPAASVTSNGGGGSQVGGHHGGGGGSRTGGSLVGSRPKHVSNGMHPGAHSGSHSHSGAGIHHGHTPSPMGVSSPNGGGGGGPPSSHRTVDPNVFKFDFDLGRFSASQQHKLKQVRDMGFANDFLNLVRLYVVNWDVHRVVNKYAAFVPNICMKYCIHYICKNKADCEYDHIDELRLPDIVFKNRNYAFGKVFCEYLLTLRKSHFNNLDYSMIYRFYGWAIRQSAQTMNDFKSAEAQFLKAIKFNQTNHYAHNEYALLLHNNFHNYEKAETHYKLSIEINPNHELYQYNYGWFLYDTLKKYQKCLPYFKRACELMPRNAHYFYWYGMALLQLNQFSESAEQLKKALSVATQDSDKQVIKERINEIESKVSLSGLFVPTMKANGIELPHSFTFDNIARSEEKLYELYSIWYERCDIYQILSFIFRFNLNFDVFIQFIETKYKKSTNSDTTNNDTNNKEIDPKFSEKNEQCLDFLEKVYKLATVFGGKRYTNDANSLENENEEAAGVKPIINTPESKENEKNILLRIVTGDDPTKTTIGQNGNDSKEKEISDDDNKDNTMTDNGDLEDFNCDKYEKEVSEMENDISKVDELSQSIDFFKVDKSAATEFVRNFNDKVKLVEMQQAKLQVVWPQSIQFLSKSVMRCQQLHQETEIEVAAAQDVYKNEMSNDFTKNEDIYNDTEKLFFDCFKGARGLKVRKLKNKLSHYESLKTKLTNLVTKYRSVQDKAEDSISLLMNKYAQTWDKLESTWYSWDVPLIVLWFRFKLLSSQKSGKDATPGGKTKPIDFNAIEENMKQANFDGSLLKMIETSDLRDFGFNNYLDYKKLFKLIKEMTKKYPQNLSQPSEDDNKSNSDLGQEPSMSGGSTTGSGPQSADPKYYCPITNRIFQNPVTAFNGVTYEKSAIIKFWKENGHTFENKDEKIDVDLAISMLYPNKQLKSEIEEFLPHLGM